MDLESQRIKVKVGSTATAADGALFISVPSLKIAEYGNPDTRVDVIVGAVGRENQETTLRVGQRLEFDSGSGGVYEIRLLSSETPVEIMVTWLGAARPAPSPSESSQE